jgi:hypothetical protein
MSGDYLAGGVLVVAFAGGVVVVSFFSSVGWQPTKARQATTSIKKVIFIVQFSELDPFLVGSTPPAPTGEAPRPVHQSAVQMRSPFTSSPQPPPTTVVRSENLLANDLTEPELFAKYEIKGIFGGPNCPLTN